MPQILILEDDADLRSALVRVFEYRGYQVDATDNGEAALERLCEEPASLVLVDARMPGMSGAAFVERCQADPCLRNVPVVLMSGDSSNQALAREFGNLTFLHKPFTMQALFSAVKEVAPSMESPSQAAPGQQAPRAAQDREPGGPLR